MLLACRVWGLGWGFLGLKIFYGFNLVFLGGILKVWCCWLVGFGVWGSGFLGFKNFEGLVWYF